MDKITLVTQRGDTLDLKVNNVNKPYIVEEILGVQKNVYNDVEYTIRLNPEKDIHNVVVHVNDERIKTAFGNNEIRVLEKNGQAFTYVIGFARLTLRLTYIDGSSEVLYSEYTSVLMKENAINVSVDKMLKYIYSNQEDILYSSVNRIGISEKNEKRYDDFWSQILLLEEIANVYAENFGFFKANSRYKLEKAEVLDRVEKLQEVDAKTVQYIAQHPEFLRKSVTGIQYGRQSYLPSKTYMTQKRITYDIYENRVVLSFLKYVHAQLHELAKKIEGYIRLLDVGSTTADGYIMTAYLIYANAESILKEFVEKTDELEKKYRELIRSYSYILDVEEVEMNERPEPTAIFMNLPQYNMIYTCMMRWFEKTGYDLKKEKTILNLYSAPTIYEAYILIKLINQIKDAGYTLEKTQKKNYTADPRWNYQQVDYNNVYIFKDDESTITLYYQPIIYADTRQMTAGVSLYRNTFVPWDADRLSAVGEHFVPDYLLKYEAHGQEKYLICDAKFSHKKKVQYMLMPEMMYKYILATSPATDRAEIKGLLIFYGIVNNDRDMESFHDNQIPGLNPKIPCAEMLPLTEELLFSEQMVNAGKMLEILKG